MQAILVENLLSHLGFYDLWLSVSFWNKVPHLSGQSLAAWPGAPMNPWVFSCVSHWPPCRLHSLPTVLSLSWGGGPFLGLPRAFVRAFYCMKMKAGYNFTKFIWSLQTDLSTQVLLFVGKWLPVNPWMAVLSLGPADSSCSIPWNRRLPWFVKRTTHFFQL